MNALKILRNNWKKSVFGLGVASYGVFSLHSYLETSKHMRKICEDVMLMNQNGKIPKRVVVILNANANKKKAETLFHKYCEPILHLNGCLVKIIKTNYSDHAKNIVENMEALPDALVIAGGDGTYSSAITGLLRRKDQPCPVLLLPLGRTNKTVYDQIDKVPKNKLEYIKMLPETVLPLVKEKLCSKSVIKFDVVDDEDEKSGGTKRKPIFGLNRLSWGVLRDIESIKDKYWIFGYLRHPAAALLNSFSKDLNWKLTTELEYTPPCPGCRNCIEEEERAETNSYLSKFIASRNDYKSNHQTLIRNENCSTKQQCHIEANQLNISCKNNTESFSELETTSINTLQPGIDFIRNIMNISKGTIQPNLILKSRTIYLNPDMNISAKGFFSIDGEEFDVRPLKISLVPNAIKLYQ